MAEMVYDVFLLIVGGLFLVWDVVRSRSYTSLT